MLYPSFKALKKRKPVAGKDYAADGSFGQDEYEFLTGTGRYSDDITEDITEDNIASIDARRLEGIIVDVLMGGFISIPTKDRENTVFFLTRHGPQIGKPWMNKAIKESHDWTEFSPIKNEEHYYMVIDKLLQSGVSINTVLSPYRTPCVIISQMGYKTVHVEFLGVEQLNRAVVEAVVLFKMGGPIYP